MNPIVEELLNINRPEFINISGSYVLTRILKKNNINSDWNSSDLDIYVSINNDTFNVFKCLDYIKKIIIFLTNNTVNQNQIIYNKMSDCSYYITGAVAKAYNQKMSELYNNTNNNLINNEYDSDDEYEEALTNVNNSNSDPYTLVSDNILDVYKLEIDNIKIDFILIDLEIDDYINNNYDLSIVKNYIDNENNIINLNNITDVKNNISSYELIKFDKMLNNVRLQKNNICKFIERIIKYNNRGIKIYLNYLRCKCNNINCLCSIKLDNNFVNIFNQGYINYYNLKKDNYTIRKCYRSTNHTGKCLYNINKNTEGKCNKTVINYNYKINEYNSEVLSDIYDNNNIMPIIFNKMILLRDLTINYTMNPKNLLNLFDDLLE